MSKSVEQVHEENKKLKEELWSRGFYVNEVGHSDEIHYLVVSCVEPKNKTVVTSQDKSN